MQSLSDAMKAFLYFIFFFMIALSQVYADVCDDALLEFQTNTAEILNKRMMAYDDLKNYAAFYSQFKTQMTNEACSNVGIDKTASDRQTIKAKRIETISKFLKLGIKEEGGRDLVIEYDFLTEKNKKYKYDFEEVFSNEREQPKQDQIVAKTSTNNEKCSDKISSNETVNLDNVRNQDGVGWCYAYAASDLLSFKLNKKISAVSLYDSGQEIEDDIRSTDSAKGGDIGLSIDNYLAKKKGLCLEEDLPSTDFKFCVKKSYENVLNNILKLVREKKFDYLLKTNLCLSNDLFAAFPAIDLTLLRSYVLIFGSKSLVEFLYDQQCINVKFQGIKIDQVSMNWPRHGVDSLMKTIDDQIDKGDVAGIKYKYAGFGGGSVVGNHASVVVGRQKNPTTGSCEYLVRNSWGKSCEQNEGPGLTCHKNCDSKNECRYSGHFWVSESRLKDALLGVTYLK